MRSGLPVFVFIALCAAGLAAPAGAHNLFESASSTAERQPSVPRKTFESAEWNLAVDYPADWSVEKDGGEVLFRSQRGVTIQLGPPNTDTPSEPAPGRRAAGPECSRITNDHGITATVCFEPKSSTRRADLVVKTPQGRQRRLALTARGGDARTFDAMVASARPYP
jgi:hypothetical protein